MAASADPKQLSPKVVEAGKLGGLIVIAVAVGAYLLESITPELLSFLGPWAPIISGALVLAGTLLRAYWATDPLRVDYFQQKAAHDDAEATALEADEYQGKHEADPTLYEGDGKSL